jgi:hypothetical protein
MKMTDETRVGARRLLMSVSAEAEEGLDRSQGTTQGLGFDGSLLDVSGDFGNSQTTAE